MSRVVVNAADVLAGAALVVGGGGGEYDGLTTKGPQQGSWNGACGGEGESQERAFDCFDVGWSTCIYWGGGQSRGSVNERMVVTYFGESHDLVSARTSPVSGSREFRCFLDMGEKPWCVRLSSTTK